MPTQYNRYQRFKESNDLSVGTQPYNRYKKYIETDLSEVDDGATSLSDSSFQSESSINQSLAEPIIDTTNLNLQNDEVQSENILKPNNNLFPNKDAFLENENMMNALQSGRDAFLSQKNYLEDPDGFKIDLDRPLIVNKDGGVSTEKSITVDGRMLGVPIGGKYFNIPTVIDGKEYSDKEATNIISEKLRSGEMNWEEIGSFDSQSLAVDAAKKRSEAIFNARRSEINKFQSENSENQIKLAIRRLLNSDNPDKDKIFKIWNPSVTDVYEKDGQWYKKSNKGGSRLNRHSDGLLDIKISKEEAAYEIFKGNTTVKWNNAVNRGYGRLQQAFNVLNQHHGLIKPEEFLRRMNELNRLYPDAPENIKQGLEEIQQTDGYWDAFKAIMRNPSAILSVSTESIVTSVPALGTFLGVSAATKNPIVGAGAASPMTYGSVWAIIIDSHLREYAAENKINLNDEAAMMEVMGDQEFWKGAKERATAYSIPVTVFDTLSMGLAGKIVSSGIAKGVGTGNIIARTGAEIGLQGMYGSAGDYFGQTAEMYFSDYREKGDIDEGDVLIEGIAELVTAPIEIATGTRSNINEAKNQSMKLLLENEAQILEKNDLLRESADRLNPNSERYQESAFAETSTPPNLENFNQRVSVAFEAISDDEVEGNKELKEFMSAYEAFNEEASKVNIDEQEQLFQQNSKELNRLLGRLEDVKSGERMPVIDDASETVKVDDEAPVQPKISDDQSVETTDVNLATENQVNTEAPKLEEPKKQEIEAPKVEETIDKFDHKSIRAKFGEGGLTEEGSELLARIEDGRINIKPDDKYNPKFVEQMKRVLRENQIPEAFLFYDEQQDSAPVYDLTNDGIVELFEFANTFNLKKQKADELGILERDVNFNNKDQFPDAPKVKTEPPKLETPKTVAEETVDLTEQVFTEKDKADVYKGKDIVSTQIKREINKQSEGVIVLTNDDYVRMDWVFAKSPKDIKGKLATYQNNNTARQALENIFAIRKNPNPQIKEIVDQVAIALTTPSSVDAASWLTNKELDLINESQSAEIFEDMEPETKDLFLERIARETAIRSFIKSEVFKRGYESANKPPEEWKKSSAAENKKTEPKTEPEITVKRGTNNDNINPVTEISDGKNTIYVSKDDDGGWYRTTKNGLGNVQPDGKFAGESKMPPLQYAFTRKEAIDSAKEQLRNPKGILFPVQTGRPKGKKSVGLFEQGGTDARTRSEPEKSFDADIADESFTTSAEEATIENIENRDFGLKGSRGTADGEILAKEMQTLRQSVFHQAFRDLENHPKYSGQNIDPNLAVNFPPARQFNLLKDLVQEKFGFTFIMRAENNSYDANQSLLDAYRNMQWMAHVLEIPYSTIGLENSLGLVLPGRTWGGYNAAYFPDGGNTQSDAGYAPSRAIIMPKRSNSFAHEWGHALDFFLMDRFGSGQNTEGITGRIKTNLTKGTKPWLDEAPTTIQEAMGDLMNAMFFENADVSMQIMEKEHELAKIVQKENETGRRVNRRAEVEKQLENLRTGRSRVKKLGKSKYRKDVEDYGKWASEQAKMQGRRGISEDYWVKPTEMFARVFEAYVAEIIEKQGGNTEFVTKSDAAYKLTMSQIKGADRRLAQTYPNEPDRNNINMAMLKLMDAIRTEFNLQAAQKPGDYDIIDYRLVAAAEIKEETATEKDSIWTQEKESWQKFSLLKEKVKQRPQRYPELGKNLKADATRTVRSMEDYWSRVAYSKRGILFRIQDKYSALAPLLEKRMEEFKKNSSKYTVEERKEAIRGINQIKKKLMVSKIIEKITSRLATDPGGRRKTVQGGTFEEATSRETRRFLARYLKIIKDHKLELKDQKQMSKLRLILTGDPDVINTVDKNDPLVIAAAKIRNQLLNPIFDYTRASELNMSYLEDGSYFTRILDVPLALKDYSLKFKFGEEGLDAPKKGLKKGGYNLYRDVIYENEMGVFEEGNVEQMLALATLGRRLKLDENHPVEGEILSQVEKLRRLAKEIEKIQKKLDSRGTETQEDGEISEDQLEMQMKLGQARAIHSFVYKNLKDPFAQRSVEDWINRLSLQASDDPEAHSPSNNFMKKRKLPKEADTYMVDFYVDPMEALNIYIPSVVRKTEFNRRFGSDLVPQGKKRGTNNEILYYHQYLLNQATKLGMDNADKLMVASIVDKVTGRDGVTKDIMGKKILDTIHATGTMALLPRAVVSSIAEPLTAGVTTGSTVKGIKTLALMFDGAFNIGTKNTRERKLFYEQVANVLGVIDDANTGEIIANRLGGTLAEDTWWNKRLTNFFVRSQLTKVTIAQRKASMRTMIQFFAEISAEYQNPKTSAKGKKRIKNIFQDYGIYDSDLTQFTKWMSEQRNSQYKMPNLDQLMDRGGALNDMGNLLAVAVGRAVDHTIQNPKIIDRPLYAEHPLGRVTYGIQSFIRAYTRNVLIASAKRVNREYEDNGFISATTMAGTNMLLPFSTLYMGHFIVNTLRELIFNREKWEEEKEKDNLEKYLLAVAVSRAGFYGGFDPVVNSIMSLKYNAELSTLFTGAQLGFYVQAFKKISRYFMENSENTQSAEYQGLIGLYDLMMAYGVSIIGGHPGFGKIVGTGLGLSSATLTSPQFKKTFVNSIIEAIYGEPYKSTSGGRKKKKDSKSLWDAGNSKSLYDSPTTKSLWD